MIRKLFILILLLIGPFSGFSQKVNDAWLDSLRAKLLIIEDTLKIEPVTVIGKKDFTKPRQYRRYWRMIRDVKKTLPYAKLTKETLDDIYANRDTLASQKDIKEYMKESEKALFKEFEQPLRNLTVRQGKTLIKLIDRETKQTSYYWLKDLKGGFSAFFWQGVARLFGSSLKYTYDPEGKDLLMEEVVRMVEAGKI